LCLTLREEHRLRMLGNKEVGRTFGPKRYKITQTAQCVGS
jgi:hypothetical protein